MVYIKRIFENVVQLAGQEVTPQMIKEGWFAYDGEIPPGENFKLVNGVLEAYTPEISPLLQLELYKRFLNDTDFKLLPGYDPKEGESIDDLISERKIAREFIRSYQRDVANTLTNLL